MALITVIARIHGAALGGGCQLAVACDLAVATEDARLGIPLARLQGHRVADFEMMSAEALSSEDLREGIRAFGERRKPRFRGT